MVHIPQLTEAEVTRAFTGAPHRMVAVPGGRIATYVFGRGPDVVLVHGWPLTGITFRRLVPRLARSFTVHVIDLPGVGQTSWDPGAPIGIAAHAATVRAWVDAHGLERFAYLANDSGGAIARLAARGDRRVAGMVLGDTELPGRHSPLVAAFVAASRTRLGRQALMAAMGSATLRRSPLLFGGCFTDPAYVDGEFGELLVRPMLESTEAARGQLDFAAALDPRDLDELAAAHREIAAEVLCIWGPDDPFFPIRHARAMLPSFAGGATLVEIPRAKLYAHEDHPDAFLDHAVPFLERVLPGVPARADAPVARA